ncbi:hypothetical protein EV426DRAFT_600952 [Tirmania nivea]|nr:hypothetical protein EV426DRAFT_600952 [Tirmania nivea]
MNFQSSPGSMCRLEEHSARLFIADTEDQKTNVDCINIGSNGTGIRNLLSHEQVCEFLNNVEKEPSKYSTPTCSIYLLKQKSTWSPLLITAADFYCLLKTNGVFSAYGDYISSFGYRSRDGDSRFGGYARLLSHDTGKLEICYNIRYPAKHGRKGSSTPWSIRQVGIYHSLNLQTGKSVWILVQCPLSIQLLVESVEKAYTGLGLHNGQPLMLHHLILNEVLRHWRDYGNYLEEMLQRINTKSQAFGSERIIKHDYNVTFDDAQDIQILEKDMLKSKHAIDSALKIVTGLQLHQGQFLRVTQRNTPNPGNDYDPIIVALESLSSRLDAESRGFLCLINLSGGVKNQVSIDDAQDNLNFVKLTHILAS